MFGLRKLKLHKIQYRDKSNTVILHHKDGRITKNPKYTKKYHIYFRGKNSVMEIFEGSSLDGSQFFLIDNDHFIVKAQAACMFVVGGKNTSLLIDEGCSLNNLKIYLNSCPGAFVKIGRDCMFSFDVVLWPSDTHQIINSTSGTILNNRAGITIGDHVWCGTRCTILKDTVIPNNCIIGAASVVCGKFKDTGCIIAGNPAKTIKQGINWKREELPGIK